MTATGPSAAALARHPHLAEPRPPERPWRVDCHVHTMWSGDSTTTPEELATATVEAGIDVLCITDHSTIAGALRLAEELPCRVVIGQEQRTPEGEIIGLFLSERIPPGCRSASEAARIVREQGGLVYVPHPFDPLRHRVGEETLRRLVDEELVDIVEARNGKTSLEALNEEAAAFCRATGVAAGGGSDAHVPEAIGAAYIEMPSFDDASEFLVALRNSSRVVGHHFDSARPWRARIVPSIGSTGARQVPGPGAS
ncbi:MAG TPA: PHP-associated domain-containing protein [Acidimicrobiales bacterium]|nr:PHP-associated domain-containing protein [Acidimicrobiales bacterium]